MKKKLSSICIGVLLMSLLGGCSNEHLRNENVLQETQKTISNVKKTKENSQDNTKIKKSLNSKNSYNKREKLLWENKKVIYEEKTFKLDTDTNYKLSYFDELYSFNSKTFTKIKYKIPYLKTVLALYKDSMFYVGTDKNYYFANFKDGKCFKINKIHNNGSDIACFRIENDILYFSDWEFLYKLNMKTREIERIDFTPYKNVINSLIGKEFKGTIYADSAGIYFLTDLISVSKFIGLSWDKQVMFSINDRIGPTITKEHIYFYSPKDQCMYKYDKTGNLENKYHPTDLVKRLEGNIDWTYRVSNNRIYYEIPKDGIYSIENNSNYKKIIDIDRNFAINKASYYDENIALINKKKFSIFNIEKQKYTLEINLENAIDQFADYYYGDKYLNYLAYFPQIRYKNIKQFSNEDVIFIAIWKNYGEDLWVINTATKEKYLIDIVKYTENPKYLDKHNRSWEKEVFTQNGTIYYFNKL
ncbi:hypothetical protein CLTEP_25670 [Clostridium tepidiprofundi DSM 19306]|uniref:Uncharacterized protein n=1 Tax=Clostridium tepidiprofundi DSM 19306 TaxID=1121338 RepID=A0A151ASH4_9CLOT|nr:hypothetical protein [Clostridium tepidiprofundi]KYH30576.1 hypothetical protein CLTEP_25670 [Clostridium tepidiprofundi DSM 19306]